MEPPPAASEAPPTSVTETPGVTASARDVEGDGQPSPAVGASLNDSVGNGVDPGAPEDDPVSVAPPKEENNAEALSPKRSPSEPSDTPAPSSGLHHVEDTSGLDFGGDGVVGAPASSRRDSAHSSEGRGAVPAGP